MVIIVLGSMVYRVYGDCMEGLRTWSGGGPEGLGSISLPT